ncbi:MAG: hypothetical protein RL563_281 [Pseudomonadota bacterium]|jgi:truncated hemoglobin YjbI
MAANLSQAIDQSLISKIIDVFYPSLLDDYRINRYFYSRPLEEQSKPLKALMNALLGGQPIEASKLSELADDFFTAAFARGNAKPSMVNNRDFAFLTTLMNGNIVGDDDGTPQLTLLCPGHSHLLRLQPIDDNINVVIEHLKSALKQLSVSEELTAELLAFAESGRKGLLGQGSTIFEDGEMSTQFRTHG